VNAVTLRKTAGGAIRILAQTTALKQDTPVPYFDHNATHPLSAAARAAWIEAVDRLPANPSSPHRLGRRASAALEEARERLAGFLGCPAESVLWTSGATESNNALIHHLSRHTEGEIWISAVEHPCLVASAHQRLPGRLRIIPVTRSGVVLLDWIQDQLRTVRPAAVLVMAANNETGVLQPWQSLRDLCHESGVAFGTDAAQWIGKLPARGLGDCEYVTGCAHKFGGPTGVGFLKVAGEFEPSILGGGQEDGRRAGTENLPGVVACVAALTEREAAMDSLPTRHAWRDAFARYLSSIPGVEMPTGDAQVLWNTVTAFMPAFSDCRLRWVVKLDRLGFSVSSGSACSSGTEKPSPVLAAMGYPNATSDRMVRFSAGWETSAADWTDLRQAIAEVLSEGL
jgi:cysteine desulfurase